MKIPSFNSWNSTARPAVESLFQQLPRISIPESITDGHFEEMVNHMKTTTNIVSNLRNLIEDHEFNSETEEIIFFKQIKPLFSGSLIYWEKLLHLFLHKPVGGEVNLKKYYKRKLKNLQAFYELHAGLYEYLRGNFDYLDKLYFLRSSRKFDESAHSIDLNPKFTTVKDRLVSEIYANELLEQFIHRLLNLQTKLSLTPDKESPNLQWTGSRAGLVELIYALHSGGVYNNGQIGIRELADGFQQLFNMDLGNYYHVFNEIRLRKKNRTALLDHLRERFIHKMDSMDER